MLNPPPTSENRQASFAEWDHVPPDTPLRDLLGSSLLVHADDPRFAVLLRCSPGLEQDRVQVVHARATRAHVLGMEDADADTTIEEQAGRLVPDGPVHVVAVPHITWRRPAGGRRWRTPVAVLGAAGSAVALLSLGPPTGALVAAAVAAAVTVGSLVWLLTRPWVPTHIGVLGAHHSRGSDAVEYAMRHGGRGPVPAAAARNHSPDPTQPVRTYSGPMSQDQREHQEGGVYSSQGKEFTRDSNYIEDRIVADPVGDDEHPVEAGRYRLVVARACPWAHRAIIVRELLGLGDAISMGVCGPTHDADSWTFDLDEGGVDPVLRIPRLKDAYEKRFPGYPRGITVPAIVDVGSGEVITNNFPQITLDFSTQWTQFHAPNAPDLYPEALRPEMDEVMQRIYTEVNNGVYRCGFAGSQESYDAAYDRLFTALDWLEERLADSRYLMGNTITEADVRLFTTLVRFDAVYHGHFKCNRNKLTEMPVLWAYTRDLFQTPGFGSTVDFEQIKQHYYIVHKDLNPLQIVPKGPDESGWSTAHGRESLS